MGDCTPGQWLARAESRERARRRQQVELESQALQAKARQLTALEQLKATRRYLWANQQRQATMRAPYETHKLTKPRGLRKED